LRPPRLPQPGGAGGVIRVGVGDEQRLHARRVQPIGLDARDDAGGVAPAPCVDQRVLVAAIQEVDVADVGENRDWLPSVPRHTVPRRTIQEARR